jgi:hypothetical protein
MKIITLAMIGLSLGVLTACAIQRAETAQKAQAQLIGLPKETILACMGPPANRAAEGSTEVWQYQSGNGRTDAALFASGNNGFASGFATTSQRFCTVNIVMAGGIVSQVNYSGPTGGLLTQGEQCAFAVQNCLK